MKKKVIILIIACFVVFNFSYPVKGKAKISRKERKEIQKNLNAKYKYWLNLVHYISLKEEKDIFLSLDNNKDRDIFINTFWKQRDPTPGTDDNEYKSEIAKRFTYVNNYFKRGSSKPGWMTDMGKFYMILGKPNSIDSFDSKPGLYPAQVWYYYGDKSLGLPTYFNITFYKPRNSTEWKMYNPSFDGPSALLIRQGPIDETDYQGLYNKIYELAPTLAMPAVTMIPNEVAPGLRPSPRSNIVLSRIYEAPKRKINIAYATHFLNYKGFVEVDSSINFLANSNLVSITRYGRFEFDFVNFSFKPKKLSVGFSEEKNQYYFNFELNVSLRKNKKFIYEYKKNFNFYFDPDKVNKLKGNGIVIHDSFPVIPGKYKLMVYAMNSIGREFTYFEKDITVPAQGKDTILVTPIIGYKSEVQQENYFFSYKFNNQKLFVDPEKNFRLKETPVVVIGVYNLRKELWENGRLELGLKGLNERVNFNKKYEFLLKNFSYKKDLNILYPIREDGLNPDYYELNVKLLDESRNELGTKNTTFSISPLKTMSYPMETFKKYRVDNPYYFYNILGTQYEKTGDMNNAEKYYKKCIQNNPGFLRGHVSYLNILNRLKKYTQVLVEVENLKKNEEFAFDYYLIRATALYGMKDFKEALNSLINANKIYNSDIRVLNLLGFTFLNLKNLEEALKALEASLSLNNEQKFILKTVEEVKKRIGLRK